MSLFNTDEGDPDPSSVARDATSAARVHSEPGGFTLNPGGVTVTPPSKEEDSGVSNQGQSSRRVGVSGDSSNLVGGDRRPEPPPPPDPDTDTDRRRQIAIEAIAQLRAQLRRTQPPIPEPIRTQAPELVGVPEPIRSDPPAQPEVRTELPPAERKPPAPRPPTDLGAWKQSHASTPDTASEALEWLGAASGGSRRVVALARPP
jgi:hypothetical protein